MNKLVAIANDHAGVDIKRALIPVIEAAGFSVANLGTDTSDSVDYPDYGTKLANAVVRGDATYGVAICGSGIGISIAANRVKGARAALVHSVQTATLARQHNDANILCLGARVIDTDTAIACMKAFLATAFEGGRHTKRVKKLG